MKLSLLILVMGLPLVFVSASSHGTSPSQDDRKIAREEFNAGRKQEKLKAWSAAISHYKNVLMLVPNYYWAHKQIGLCHYMSGNYDSAFESYRKYLKANPKDKKTRAFVGKLHQQLKSGELYKRLAPKKTGRELLAAPYLSLGGGMAMVSSGDVEEVWGEFWAVEATGILPAFSIEAGYLFSNGIYLQGSSFQAMKRTVKVGKSKLPGVAQDLDLNLEYTQSALMLMAGWVHRVGRHGLLGVQAGVGSTGIRGPAGTNEDSIAWSTEARADWLLGTQWSLGLRLGWFSAKFTDFELAHEGLMGRLALQWYLFPMRDKP